MVSKYFILNPQLVKNNSSIIFENLLLAFPKISNKKLENYFFESTAQLSNA